MDDPPKAHRCSSGQAGLERQPGPWSERAEHLHYARSCRTCAGMIVQSIRHRGLRQLFENDSSRLLKQDLVERVRGILAALAMAENMEGFIREAAPGWRVHRLSGERRNEWSVSVSGNWRITFEERNGAIERMNLEDYH